MTLRIVFTGTGSIARTHAQAAPKLPDGELTAVVNHRPESMAAFAADFGIPRQYLDGRIAAQGRIPDIVDFLAILCIILTGDGGPLCRKSPPLKGGKR